MTVRTLRIQRKTAKIAFIVCLLHRSSENMDVIGWSNVYNFPKTLCVTPKVGATVRDGPSFSSSLVVLASPPLLQARKYTGRETDRLRAETDRFLLGYLLLLLTIWKN